MGADLEQVVGGGCVADYKIDGAAEMREGWSSVPIKGNMGAEGLILGVGKSGG